MEYPETQLKGVARAKYMRDLTRRINCLSEKHSVTKPLNKISNKLDSKKKKNKPEKLNLKLEPKLPEQEYMVQRLKFLKQNIETVNAAVNQNSKLKSNSSSSPRPNFEEMKKHSYEIEKQKLKQLYKADIQNFHVQSPKNPSTYPSALPLHSIITKAVNSKEEEIEIPHSDEKILSDNSKATASPKVKKESNSTQSVVQIYNNVLQNIDDDNSRALAIPVNKVTNSRRICFRHRRYRQYTTKPFCAHCHELITEIAYFSGTQQLCFDCADRHFQRVSQARYRDRPMAYREFKNIGGDTIYNQN